MNTSNEMLNLSILQELDASIISRFWKSFVMQWGTVFQDEKLIESFNVIDKFKFS